MLKIFRRKQTSEVTVDSLLLDVEEYQERVEFLTTTVVALFSCVKEFAHGFPEIHSEVFAARIEELKQVFTNTRTTALLRRRFTDQQEEILDFITREKAYLKEREDELKAIIEMLTQAMTAMYGDSQLFTNTLYERNLRMEELTRLDDIKRIKQTLQAEVTVIKTIIREKQVAEQQRMETLAREVAILRNNLEKANDAATTDTLTGALNRLAFDTNLQRCLDRNQIAYAPFCLLLCDLDDFKGINDTHGHLVGDRVLAGFVRECKGFFRDNDIIARYGGEEFAIILPNAPLKHAVKRARTFCAMLGGKGFLIDQQRPGEVIRFTASIGITESRRADTPDAIFARADSALYLAKRTGKRRAMTDLDVKRYARRLAT